MRRRAKIAAGIFFGVMIAFTFLSRTIYRSTLPQVRTEKAFAGMLEYSLHAQEFDMEADELVSVCVPFAVSALTVEQVYAQPGQAVSEGDMLLRFYAPQADAVLEDAQKDLSARRIALRQHENALLEERQRIIEEMERDAYGGSAELRARMEMADEGIVNGVSLDMMRSELIKAEERAGALEAMQADGWLLRSPIGGTVASVSVEEWTGTAGLEHLLYLIPEGEQIHLGVKVDSLPDTRAGKWQWSAALIAPKGEIDCGIAGVDAGEIHLLLPDGIAASDVIGITVKLQSVYYDMLLPVGYLDGESVLVMEGAPDDWGQTAYYAARRELKLGPGDGKSIVVEGGLDRSDRVIVSSTGPVYDGRQVLPEGYAD